MTGWLIFGGIVLFIVFLLICSVRINIAYENELDYKVTYLFFRIYPTSEKAKARKKKKEARKKEKELKKSRKQSEKSSTSTTLTENTASDKPVSAGVNAAKPAHTSAASAESSTASSNKTAGTENKDNGKIPPKKAAMDFDYIMQLVDGASPPVKRIISKIRVNNLYVDYVVGGADAAAVALKYGAVNAGVGIILGWLAETVRLHKKEILIEADFAREKSDIFVYCDVKLRLGTALACGIWLLWRMLKIQIAKTTPKKRKKRRKSSKPAVKKQST